jgi:sugar phosphate isomerase/epimerase
VADAGYAGLEILIHEQWLDWKDPADVARLKALLNRHHLACPAVCWRGNQGDLLFTNPANYASSKAYLAECVDVATAMRAEAVLVWPRIAEGVSRPDALAAAARVLNDVGDLCRQRGVVVSLEFESVGNPLCGTPAETIELIEKTGDFVTICCDTFHLYNRKLDAYASVLPQRGKIGLVHLSDGERQVPGDSDFDFASFVKAIKEIDYRGPIFVQVDPRSEGDIARAYRRAVEIVAPLGR